MKRYGAVQALAGASFDVRAGELVGLLGPNGAGKTTMIKAIAGPRALDAGAVRLFGRTLARGDKRPELGVVPQELAVYPLLTARENLEVFGAALRRRRARISKRARGLGARVVRSQGPRQRADEAFLGRHEAAAEHRLQPAAPAVARAARRADRRRRPAEPRAHLRDARRAARVRACRSSSRRIISRKPSGAASAS